MAVTMKRLSGMSAVGSSLRPELLRSGRALIQGKYIAFQEWYWERELAAGSSEEDIREYPTTELIRAMLEWKEAGEPV